METNDPRVVKKVLLYLASADFPSACGYIYAFMLILYDRLFPNFCVVFTIYNKLSHIQRKICVLKDTRVGKNISIYYFPAWVIYSKLLFLWVFYMGKHSYMKRYSENSFLRHKEEPMHANFYSFYSKWKNCFPTLGFLKLRDW